MRCQIHGYPAPEIKSIAVESTLLEKPVNPDSEQHSSIVVTDATLRQIQSIIISGPKDANLVIIFDDGAELIIAFERFLIADETPFYKILEGGRRTARLQVQAVRHRPGIRERSQSIVDSLGLFCFSDKLKYGIGLHQRSNLDQTRTLTLFFVILGGTTYGAIFVGILGILASFKMFVFDLHDPTSFRFILVSLVVCHF